MMLTLTMRRALMVPMSCKPLLCQSRYQLLSSYIDGLFRCLATIPGNGKKVPHVAVVGSGPAGYYVAQQLLKGDPGVVVDMFEKLPVPFGLVRFGVAPDHPEVKNVIHTFTQTGQNERCNFYGNVEIGKDISLHNLRDCYAAVILCYGAADDRILGIPGEDLANVVSARSFVGWYNGLPQDRDLQVNLDCETAVILGHGNVALDVARILLTPVNILEKTDITEHALECLRRSKVKTVHLVGRRGPLQVAFTIKELREMIKLPGTRTVIRPDDVRGLDKIIKDLPRPRRRLVELMYKNGTTLTEENLRLWAAASREWRLCFLRSPVQILGSDHRNVSGIELSVNKLQGEDVESQKPIPTDMKETIECGLVLRSIGYRSLPLDNTVPFDHRRGVVDNVCSRVTGLAGVYCAGWAASGPVGVIAGTMTNAMETGKLVLQDLKKGLVDTQDIHKRNLLIDQLRSRAVTFKQWETIDMAETAAGNKLGKPREKMTNVLDMLRLVHPL